MLHWVYLVSLVLVGLLFLLFAIYSFPETPEGGRRRTRVKKQSQERMTKLGVKVFQSDGVCRMQTLKIRFGVAPLSAKLISLWQR